MLVPPSLFSHKGAQDLVRLSGQFGFFQPKKFPGAVIGLHWFGVHRKENVFSLAKWVQSEQLKHFMVPKEEPNATEIIFNTSGKYSYLLPICWDKHIAIFKIFFVL